MKKSKNTIIYMLIALVVAVAAVFVDFGSCYAQSYSEDVQDADIKYYDDEWNLVSEPWEGYVSDFDVRYPVKSEYSSCRYSENMLLQRTVDYQFASQQFTLYSDSEIVCVVADHFTKSDYDSYTPNASSSMIGKCFIFLVSDSVIYSSYYYDLQSGDTVTRADSSFDREYNEKWWPLGKYVMRIDYNYPYHFAIGTGKMKVFNSLSDADNYFKTGDTSNMAWQGSEPKQTYSPELLLNDFDVQFHDSNKFDECYLDVKYSIPESLKTVSSFQIDMEEQFEWTGHLSGSVSDMQEKHTGTNYVDVLNHADGFRIYLKDIKAIDNFINKYDGFLSAAYKRQVLGSFAGVNIPFGDSLLGRVKVSCLGVKFHLVANKEYGHYVDYNLNLLTGIGVKNSYVPDIEGNYTFNNDTKVNGHYYTDVGTDAAGNTTYNYYYYYSDGSKEKVSSEDAANNTVSSTIEDGAIRIDNSPTFNNNITVEGDTISNSANSYADSKSDATTNKSFIDKFLGFFDIIENNSFLGVFAKVFGWLPVGVSSLITTAIGIIVGVRVFKFFK